MFKDKNKVIFYSLSILFIVINLALIAYDFYYFTLLPIVLLFLLAALVSIDKVLFAIVFLTPLSVQLYDIVPSIPVNMTLPTEPLLAGVLFLFVCKLLLEGKFDKLHLQRQLCIRIRPRHIHS